MHARTRRGSPAPRAATWAVIAAAVAVAGCTAPPQSVPTGPTVTNPGAADHPTTRRDSTVRIRLEVDGHALGAVLHDNPAALDLARLLPLTLTLDDFHGTERIAYPPRALDTTGAPTGMAPTAGDIAYYAPWGNVAMYYADAAYDAGLVPLGRLDPRAADALAGLGENATVIIRLA
jgi:hypothetical protein